MSDVMLFGALRMPYKLAMSDEISRLQFYQRAQEAADRLERAEAATEAAKATSVAVGEPDPDVPEALQLLSDIFDSWENGVECYEDPEELAGYIGMAFKMDDEVFERCCALLNRRNPPRNAALAATAAPVLTNILAELSIPDAKDFDPVGLNPYVVQEADAIPKISLSDDQLDKIARSYFAEEWAQNHLKNAIHDAFITARSQP